MEWANHPGRARSKPGATKREEVEEVAKAPDPLNPTELRDPLADHMMSMQNEMDGRTSHILLSYRGTARRSRPSNSPR